MITIQRGRVEVDCGERLCRMAGWDLGYCRRVLEPGGNDGRRLLLRDGSLSWLFPGVRNVDQAAVLRRLLTRADERLQNLGRILGIHARAVAWDPPSYRLAFHRLGPAPRFPTTELICEGWSNEAFVVIRLWTPTNTTTAERIGPPWMVAGWIEVPCDVQGLSCPGHLVRERVGTPTDVPNVAAEEVGTVADWVFDILTAAPPRGLRDHDTHCGPPAPRRD